MMNSYLVSRNPLEAGQKFNVINQVIINEFSTSRNPLEAGQKFNDLQKTKKIAEESQSP